MIEEDRKILIYIYIYIFSSIFYLQETVPPLRIMPNIGPYWKIIFLPCYPLNATTTLTSTEASGTKTTALPVLWPRLVASRSSQRQKKEILDVQKTDDLHILTCALQVVGP